MQQVSDREYLPQLSYYSSRAIGYKTKSYIESELSEVIRSGLIEYAGLDGAFLAHCRLRRLQVVLWNQWLDAKVYVKPPDPTRK